MRKSKKKLTKRSLTSRFSWLRCAPRKAFHITLVKVQLIQSLASRIIPSLAGKRVTASRRVDRKDAGRKPKGWTDWAPKLTLSWEADIVAEIGRQ